MDEDVKIMLIMLLAGAFIGSLLTGFVMSDIGIDISQETGNDICRQLTGNESAIAEDDWDTSNDIGGKLVCVTPSYDSTQNIIVKNSAE